MKPFKALFRQLLGVRYERIKKSLLACLIFFLALYAAKIRVAIAPIILFLTAALLPFEIVWRAMGSGENADWMMGLFALPFYNRGFVASYVLILGIYAFITKVLPVLTVFWTVGTWEPAQAEVALLCACNGCALAGAWYAMLAEKQTVPAVLWGCGVILSLFFVKPLSFLGGINMLSIIAAIFKLVDADAYLFYRPVSAKRLINRAQGKGNVLLYLLRYVFTNKSYLMNTAGLWAIACFLPLMFGQLEGINAMPLGFAILCLNTPIGILLSCDPGLEQAIRALPGQAMRFCSRYCLFIFAVNMAANSIYLISWQLQNGGVGDSELLAAVLFALQSAILSVLLEWLHPLRNWKIENDLWHHPRKYIVPLFMMLTAVFLGARPLSLWIWLGIMLAECCVLIIIARRI